jgi:broad specificity phosphatase PhoE
MINLTSLFGQDQSDKTFCIVIRHADRDKIPDGVHDIITTINNIGAENAQQFGGQLKCFEHLTIFSSPVERCIQTSKHIIIGFKGKNDLIITKMLGEPGPFVYESEIAKRSFITLGTKTLIEKMIENEEIAGVYPVVKGSEKLKHFIFNSFSRKPNKTLSLFITHDAILAPFIFYLTGEKFGHQNWIDFLDGIYFSYANEKITVVRNFVRHEIY